MCTSTVRSSTNTWSPHTLSSSLGARMDALGVRHEEVQQAELGRPKNNGRAARRHTVRGGIKPQAVDLDRIFGRLGLLPAQHRLDAGSQFAGREGLGDVVVGTGFQTRDLGLFVAARREHDDGHAAGALVAAQAARQIDAALAGQHPVQQDQIRQFRLQQPQCGFGVGGAQRVVTGAGERDADQFLDGRFVLDDKNAGHDGCASVG